MADDVVDCRDDRLAMAVILCSVPAEMLSTLHRKRTAQVAWDAVKTIHVGVERVHESNTQQLRCEFVALSWKENESAEDFSVWINGLANNLCILSDEIADVEVVRKMLQVIPEHLSQVAISIETLIDLCTVSVEEIVGRLSSVEQRRKPAPVLDSQGRLLLCEEEWLAKMRIREAEKENSGGSNVVGGKRGGKAHGRGRGNPGGSCDGKAPADGPGQPKKTNKCSYCGKRGHWARDCRSRKRAEAHLAQRRGRQRANPPHRQGICLPLSFSGDGQRCLHRAPPHPHRRGEGVRPA